MGKNVIEHACGGSVSQVRLRHVMPDATIHTLGRVLEACGAVLYRVSLPNGKIILAHLSKPLADKNAVFSPGDMLVLELTPYDFDTARILIKEG